MIVIHDAVDGPLRMFFGTVLGLAFLRWVVWLLSQPVPEDKHPEYMSEDWRVERRFWVDKR